MDFVERMELIEKIEEPLDQTYQRLEIIKKSKEIAANFKETNQLDQVCESLECISKTIEEARNGGSLTINCLKLDAENLISNIQELKKELDKTEKVSSSKKIIKNLLSDAGEIKNIIISHYNKKNISK